MAFCIFVGNIAKARISKRRCQESKAHQIFRKMNVSYPLIRTRTCAYQGVRSLFFEKFGVFCFLETPVLRFALLPYYRQYFMRLSTKFSVISMKLIGSLKIQRSRRLTLLGKTTKTHKYQSLVNFKEQKFFICLSISFFCFFFCLFVFLNSH